MPLIQFSQRATIKLSQRAFSSCSILLNNNKQQLLEQWRETISRKKVIEHDAITPSAFNLLGNTLNDPVYRHDYLPKNGTELPPAWHQAYFPPRVTEQELSPDGYEQDWKPPSPFTHRMWAGGELEWNVDNPLRVGDQVEMVSSLRDIQFRPAGRRGDSVFIWIDKKISNQKGWAMTETRSWVYVQPTSSSPDKNGSSSSSKKTQAIFGKQGKKSNSISPSLMIYIYIYIIELPHHDFSFEITPTPITLFRFSALTFNSHLIHYDHQYATETEHHRGN